LNVPLVTSLELMSQENVSDKSPQQAKPDEMDHFLAAINEIIHADVISKHPVEQEQVNKITRVVPKKGEQCRDVLLYISHLRKHFNDQLAGLEGALSHSKGKFEKFREMQTAQNNVLSSELDKVRKLTAALKSRD
jgi:hypothetical protein